MTASASALGNDRPQRARARVWHQRAASTAVSPRARSRPTSLPASVLCLLIDLKMAPLDVSDAILFKLGLEIPFLRNSTRV